jgi:hypothetical protein
MTDLTESPGGADGPPQPSQAAVSATVRKTPIHKKWWFWASAVLVVGAIGVGGGALATKSAGPASPASSDSATQTAEGTALPSGAATTTAAGSKLPTPGEPTGTAAVTPSEPAAEEPSPVPAETPPSAAKSGTWVRVTQMSGYGNKRSAPFRLAGGAIRLKYSVKGDEVQADIYVLAEDAELRGAGGVPAVMAVGAVTDEIELKRDAGRYCLEVTTADGSWVVTIEEQR